MRAPLESLVAGAVRRGRGVLAATGALLAVALAGLPGLGSDNSPEVWFVRGSEAVERDRRIAATFERREIVRLVLADADRADEAALAWWHDAVERARELPGVRRVTDVRVVLGQTPPAGGHSPSGSAGPVARGLGLGAPRGSALTALVELDLARPEVPLGALERLVATAPAGTRAEVVGLAALNRALDRSSREIGRRFAPALVAFAAALVLVLLRSLRGLAVCLAAVGAVEGLVVGAMGWAGVEWNLVLAILPPVLFVVALATTVHLLTRFRHHRLTLDPPAAARATWRDKGWSVLATGATTLTGFLALATSPVGPVRDLGLWIGLGVALLTAVAALVVPVLLARLDPGPRGPGGFESWAEARGETWGRWAARRRRPVAVGAALVAVLAAAGLPRLRPESNALRYLDPAHPVRSGFERLEVEGIGLATVELVARRADRPFTASELARLGGIEALDEGPVLHRFDPSTLLAEARDRLGSDPGADLLLAAVRTRPEGRQLLAETWNEEAGALRVLLFVETAGAEELLPAIDRWAAAVEAELEGVEVDTGGGFPLLLEAQRTLLGTLVASLGLTLLVVAVLLRVLLPSTRLAALALLPNLWPVLGVLGLMGWAGIPLDVATVMVASVVLGLAIDDTVHTLGPFRRHAPRLGAVEAVARTLRRTAGAYLLTGAILAAGFGICSLSDFAPTRRFGALSASAILMALVGDLLLLPALLAFVPDPVARRLAPRTAPPR